MSMSPSHTGVWSHQCWADVNNHFPQPAGSTLHNATLRAVGLLCHKGTLLTHGQQVAHKDPPVLLCRAAFKLSAPICYWCLGLFIPRCKTSDFSSLKCMRFLFAYFSILSRSLWMAAQPSNISAIPPSSVSPGNLLSMHSVVQVINEDVQQYWAQ